MSTNLKALIAKLNPASRRAMEFAANLALTRTHHEVDIEHVLLAFLDRTDTDVALILQAYGVDASRWQKDLQDSLGQFRTGNTRNPVLSRHITGWLESAWLRASVNYEAKSMRSGYMLLELLVNQDIQRTVGASCQLLRRIPAEELEEKLPQVLRLSKELVEDTPVASEASDAVDVDAAHSTLPTPALDRYTVDLTAQARMGKLDPVLGRDAEVRQMLDILLRRRQNNPILTGEPGVGKTAVVEGLAQRIAQGDVPEALKDVVLRTLDLGLLQAGASVKGEFESRLRSVISEVKTSAVPVILFIDEAHTIIGAGGQAGQNDAANLLKPALARGELRTIAATTWAEYKKYFEKDAALARRFQVVKVEEPSEDDAIQMLRGVAATMEAHHKVRILDEAVVEAVRISSRYMSGRQLPDKAISVLDTACARVALSRAGMPPALADVQRLMENVDREMSALRKEGNPEHAERIAELQVRRIGLEKDQSALREAFDIQRALVDEITSLRRQLKDAELKAQPGDAEAESRNDADADDVAPLRAALEHAKARLLAQHRTHLMVYDCVDGPAIADVVSAWTGIPLGRIVTDELKTVRTLKDLLEQRVVGQAHALEAIARRIQIAKAGLEDPGKPKGVFLLAGPSGVGKTETALALAETLYGGERNLVTINMSEYQEAHSVASLKGSPPGYVGFGEGGILTEAVRRKPYSVVLLDEAEKAHPDVLELFFQVFDKGVMEDAEGREVDFRNTIIILTSNVGTELIHSAVEHGVTVDGKKRHPQPADLLDLMRSELQRVFKPAFLGRLNVIPYYPLTDDAMRRIVELKLAKVKRRLMANHGAALEFDGAIVKAIVSRCTEIDSGARDADSIIANTVLGQISDRLLARMAEEKPVRTVELKVKRDKMSVTVD